MTTTPRLLAVNEVNCKVDWGEEDELEIWIDILYYSIGYGTFALLIYATYIGFTTGRKS